MKSRTELVKSLQEHGCRVFSTEEFASIATALGYSAYSIRQLIFELKKEKVIEPIKYGLYSLHNSFLSVPISAYEIAMYAVKEGFLSYISAVSIHGLTDQLPIIMYVSTANGASKNKIFEISGSTFKVVKTRPERVFGIEKKWIGEAMVRITDLEKTLIDGLTRPAYCAGFREVIYYFQQAKPRIDTGKIIDYAALQGSFCLQRLGWMFEYIEYVEAVDAVKARAKFKTYAMLDSSGMRRGTHNETWKIIENI